MQHPHMTFDRAGIILYVIRYQECLNFYQQILSLPIMFKTDSLTCFQFAGSYLMVEIDDETERLEPEKGIRIRSCLRMNVPDVKQMADRLRSAGVEVDYQEHAWGTVAKFFDPDGNLCAFKDSTTFERQIQEHAKSLI